MSIKDRLTTTVNKLFLIYRTETPHESSQG